jgi:hypothetical protein
MDDPLGRGHLAVGLTEPDLDDCGDRCAYRDFDHNGERNSTSDLFGFMRACSHLRSFPDYYSHDAP